MRQESRGWLKLKSNDPRDHPIIDPNYLSTGLFHAFWKGKVTFRCFENSDKFCNKTSKLNCLILEMDRWEMRESIKLSREIFAQKAFDEFRDGETEPGEDATTDEKLDEFVREKADSAYHPSCTCKMGDPNTDPMAVLDSSTKVVGKLLK